MIIPLSFLHWKVLQKNDMAAGSLSSDEKKKKK